jgi:hypothetical protein
MKVTALAQGTGVPAQSDNSLGKTADPGKIARAKAIASGQSVAEMPQSSGDVQVDKAQESIRRIKMRTQQSTNRHDNQVVEEPVGQVVPEVGAQKATLDTKEPVNGTEETKPIDPQVAAFIKAKRALQVKEREIAQREEALKSQVPQEQENVMAKLKANPLSVLQEAGVTYDQLTEAILANQNGVTPEITALKAEIKALKEGLDERFVSRDQQAEQQVLADIRKDALALTATGEQFEAIREAKAQNKVVDLIHRTWKATGEILDVPQAAELVENQLIEEALPFAKLQKVQSRLTPAQAAQVEKILTEPKPNTKVMRTLTNRDNAMPIMDKRARAIAAMQGTLKRG